MVLSVFFRKLRSLLWWTRVHFVPAVWSSVLGRMAVLAGRDDGPVRGWRHSRLAERFWTDPDVDGNDGARFVLRLARPILYGDSGTIIAGDRCLLTDVSPAWSTTVWAQDVMKDRRIVVADISPGSIAQISARSAFNYYHWMLEVLPRIGLITRSGAEVDRYVVAADQPFQLDSLALAGISPDQLGAPPHAGAIRVEVAYVPSLLGKMGQPTRFAIDYLREIFAAHLSTSAPFRRIYVSRQDAGLRRVRNEADLLDALTPLGFEPVSLTGMTLTDQARLFSEAELVAGPHGAGMTNAAFLHRESRGLLDATPATYDYPCFGILCAKHGVPYRRLAEESTGDPRYDMIVDIARFVSTAQDMLATHRLPAENRG